MGKHSIGKGIIDGTVVKIEHNGDFSTLRTYSREHGRSTHFMISRDLLERLGDGAACIDKDIYSFLVMRRVGSDLRLQITWLSRSYDRVHGYIEDITMPYERLTAHLQDDQPICFLHHKNQGRVKLDFSCASRTIQEICANKRRKRAFIKGISRNFHWQYGDTIRFFNDGKASFFFREGDKGMCGGFVLHRDFKPKEPGQEPKMYYSVHT